MRSGDEINILSELDSYLINLETRRDRLNSSKLEAKKLGLNLIRVDAFPC